MPSIILLLVPPITFNTALFVNLSVVVILDILVANIAFTPSLVINVAFITPLFSNEPLFVIAFLIESEPILPLFIKVVVFSTLPSNIVFEDKVVLPALVKAAVTLLLNTAILFALTSTPFV